MSTTTYSSNNVLNAVAAAAKVLDERKEEVNRLNVFPVPDGDTGTNMSLTIQSVVSNVANLPIGASGADIRKAVTTGALMGARGNSGVITSQILRGLCEGSQGFDEFDVESIAGAFDRAREVAFQAVRKPVEGTILTVLRDSAAAAKNGRSSRNCPCPTPWTPSWPRPTPRCSARPTFCLCSRSMVWWTPAVSGSPSSSTPSPRRCSGAPAPWSTRCPSPGGRTPRWRSSR